MNSKVDPVDSASNWRGATPLIARSPSVGWMLRTLITFLAATLVFLWGTTGALLALGCIVAVELSLRLGPLPVVYAIALLAFPPGLLAGNGLTFLIAAAIIVGVPILINADARELGLRGVALLSAAPPIVAASHFISGNRSVELLLVIASLGIPIFLLGSRVTFAQRTVSAMAWIVALLSTSYLTSLATGAFVDSEPTLREFPNNLAWNIYFPYTPTVGGTQVLGPTSDLPRFVVLTHEPGLSVFVLAVALSYFMRSGVRNRLGLALVLSGILATQSMGTYLSLTAGFAAAMVLYLWERRKRIAAIGMAAAGPLIVYQFAVSAVETRLTRSATTLYDRGLGGGDTLAVGNVSLRVGLEHYTSETAVLIVALLVAAACLAINMSGPGVLLLVATFVSAAFNEPLQWQFGIWVILAIQFVAARRPAPARTGNESVPSSMRRGGRMGWRTGGGCVGQG